MLDLERELERLSQRVIPLERFVHFLDTQLGPPSFYRSLEEARFRYRAPNYRHFVLLRSCRMISGLNAAISLARAGYPQELGVVLRTVIEYYTQVEYVLIHRSELDGAESKAGNFVRDFFLDDRRTGPTAKAKRVKLNQKDVHDAVGRQLDEFAPNDIGKTASQLMSNVYVVFSNYVHGRYPESMDLFGGRPGQFHLRGMRGTPKDHENVEVIDTLLTSVSNCLLQVVQAFELRESIRSDDVLRSWYSQGVGLAD